MPAAILIEQAPLTALVAGLVARHIPSISDCRRWLAARPLSKGASTVQPSISDLKTAFAEFQGLVKLLAPLAPGADVPGKAQAIDQRIDPVVDKWLLDAGAPPEVINLINTGIDWAITAELNAVMAPANQAEA